MKSTFWLIILPWTFNALTADLQLTDSLKHNLKDSSPWLVLGLVADSETQSSITPKGQELRKELEQQIQKLGGEILPLPLSQRMKLERLWSLPFSGTFNDELKEEATQLKANIITGSFNPLGSGEAQILTFDIENKKTLIHYCVLNTPVTSELPQTTHASPTQMELEPLDTPRASRSAHQPIVSALDKNPWGIETFEPTRQKPDERARRRTRNPRATEARNKLIQDHFSNNKVLKQFQMEHQQKSTNELIAIRNNLIQRAQSSFMTSSKIELYSRAYIINDLLQPADLQTEDKLLELLQDHQEFFLERKN